MMLQVIQQPAGTYTPQQHSLRVAPLFAEPILAFLLYYVILGAMHLWDKRDKRRVDVLSKKLRKMVSELKVSYTFLLSWISSVVPIQVLPCRAHSNVTGCFGRIHVVSQDSTRYEKTAKLLERFDPDYVPPTPRKQQQQHALRTAFIPPTPRGPGVPTPVHPLPGSTTTLPWQSHNETCTELLMMSYIGVHQNPGVQCCDVRCVCKQRFQAACTAAGARRQADWLGASAAHDGCGLGPHAGF